ncbi:MAG: YSC84-related protein [Vicinamibacterales bacterium]
MALGLLESSAQGLFAGATVEGASLRDDRDANRALYGKVVTPDEILGVPGPGPLPRAAETWQAALTRISASAGAK